VSTVVDVATIVALIGGPIGAVLVSTQRERQRAERTDRLNILRTLLVGRVNFADPAFQAAVSTVPLIFHKYPSVMTAWDNYIDVVNTPEPADTPGKLRQRQLAAEKTDELCNAIGVSLGFEERHRSRMVKTVYSTTSYAANQIRIGEALDAIKLMGQATNRLADVNEHLAKRLTQLSTAAIDDK
jgi:hypothetical protein